MELHEVSKEEVLFFIKKLEELPIIIKETIEKQTFTINGESYLTNNDMYKILHISKRALQKYRRTNKIPFIKFGGKVLYKKSDVLKILEKNYYNPNL